MLYIISLCFPFFLLFILLYIYALYFKYIFNLYICALQSLKLLSVMAALRLDDDDSGEIDSTLSSALLNIPSSSNTKDRSIVATDPLASSSWEKVSILESCFFPLISILLEIYSCIEDKCKSDSLALFGRQWNLPKNYQSLASSLPGVIVLVWSDQLNSVLFSCVTSLCIVPLCWFLRLLLVSGTTITNVD